MNDSKCACRVYLYVCKIEVVKTKSTKRLDEENFHFLGKASKKSFLFFLLFVTRFRFSEVHRNNNFHFTKIDLLGEVLKSFDDVQHFYRASKYRS